MNLQLVNLVSYNLLKKRVKHIEDDNELINAILNYSPEPSGDDNNNWATDDENNEMLDDVFGDDNNSENSGDDNSTNPEEPEPTPTPDPEPEPTPESEPEPEPEPEPETFDPYPYDPKIEYWPYNEQDYPNPFYNIIDPWDETKWPPTENSSSGNGEEEEDENWATDEEVDEMFKELFG